MEFCAGCDKGNVLRVIVVLQNATATWEASEPVSVIPMATSSDVILTSRHSDTRLNGRTAASQPSRPTDPGSGDSDVNVAACYGVDTVHSWATVSAASGLALRQQQMSGWRSDMDLHAGTQTVSYDTSPVHNNQLAQSTRPGLSAGISVPDVRVQSLEPPRPPPRTKRKARAPLPPSFSASPDNGTMTLYSPSGS